jgi:hypothetical protein
MPNLTHKTKKRTKRKKPDTSQWEVTKLEDQLYPVTKALNIKSFSWKAKKGILKWSLYVYKTNTFHLFATRKERQEFERKLQGRRKTNKLGGKTKVLRGRFRKPLLHWVDWFIQK